MVAWFGAFISLALCAVEIEPICYAADNVPVLKKLIENCLILKIGTSFAAISGFVNQHFIFLLVYLHMSEANE